MTMCNWSYPCGGPRDKHAALVRSLGRLEISGRGRYEAKHIRVLRVSRKSPRVVADASYCGFGAGRDLVSLMERETAFQQREVVTSLMPDISGEVD